MHSWVVNCSEMFTWKYGLTYITSIWTVSLTQRNDRISHPCNLTGLLYFSKRAKIAINLGLQIVRVLYCVIIKVIGATKRAPVASLVDTLLDLKSGSDSPFQWLWIWSKLSLIGRGALIQARALTRAGALIEILYLMWGAEPSRGANLSKGAKSRNVNASKNNDTKGSLCP